MIRNLATELIWEERITTTVARAKLLRPYAERMITKARTGTLHARRQILADIEDTEVVTKLFDDIAERYADRPGGLQHLQQLICEALNRQIIALCHSCSRLPEEVLLRSIASMDVPGFSPQCIRKSYSWKFGRNSSPSRLQTTTVPANATTNTSMAIPGRLITPGKTLR